METRAPIPRLRAAVGPLLVLSLVFGCSSRAVGSGSEEGTETGPTDTTSVTTSVSTSLSSGSASSAATPTEDSSTGTSTISGASSTSTTGDAPAYCEEGFGQENSSMEVEFGDWPPTGEDTDGSPTWDVEVVCIYAGPSKSGAQHFFSCDDRGIERTVEFDYDTWPYAPLPLRVGDTFNLRAHTGEPEWIVLSSQAGQILALGIAGSPEPALADQSDYEPFEFEVAKDLCPLNVPPVMPCQRKFGLDITVAGTTTRVFEGPAVTIPGPGGSEYTVYVDQLSESTNEEDAACPVWESIRFVILPSG